jgi:hypothetical protein
MVGRFGALLRCSVSRARSCVPRGHRCKAAEPPSPISAALLTTRVGLPPFEMLLEAMSGFDCDTASGIDSQLKEKTVFAAIMGVISIPVMLLNFGRRRRYCRAGCPSLRAIAAELNRRSIPPESGRGEWQAVQVARVLEKIGR